MMKQPAAKKGHKRKKAAEAGPSTEGDTMNQAPDTGETPVADATEVLAIDAGQAPSNQVSLASNCTVRDAAALKQALMALRDTAEAVVIDASAVERIDTATFQLLYAFVHARVGADREVVWHAPSNALLNASKLLGVTELLCLPTRAEAA